MIKIGIIREKYNAEIALSILACRVYFKTADQKDLENFIQISNVQWPNFQTLCRHQRTRIIVYNEIVQCAIPQEIKTALLSELVLVKKNNWELARETERIMKLLKQNSISTLPYKGAAFSKQFFGDIFSRESTDIDLVIQRKDLAKVIDVMKMDGYVSELEGMFQYLGNKYFAYYKDYNFNKFSGTKRTCHIEFHWEVTERILSMPEETTCLIHKQGNIGILLKEETTFINSTSHFIALLVHHSRKDVLKHLKTIVDIGVGIQDQFQILDQNELNTYIRNLKLQRSFDVSLNLIDDLFGVKSAEYNGNAISRRVSSNFTTQLLGNKLKDVFYLSRPYLLNHIMLRDNFTEKVKFSLNFMWVLLYPTTLDFNFIRLPKYLFFMYPFVKPIRVFAQWGSQAKAA